MHPRNVPSRRLCNVAHAGPDDGARWPVLAFWESVAWKAGRKTLDVDVVGVAVDSVGDVSLGARVILGPEGEPGHSREIRGGELALRCAVENVEEGVTQDRPVVLGHGLELVVGVKVIQAVGGLAREVVRDAWLGAPADKGLCFGVVVALPAT